MSHPFSSCDCLALAMKSSLVFSIVLFLLGSFCGLVDRVQPSGLSFQDKCWLGKRLDEGDGIFLPSFFQASAGGVFGECWIGLLYSYSLVLAFNIYFLF